MPAAVDTPRSTERPRLDEAVSKLRGSARLWATLPVPEKIALARHLLSGAARVADRSAAAACAAKGIPPGSPLEGEESLSGPYVTIRMLRHLVTSLTRIQRHGNTAVGRLGRTVDGRLTVRVFPATRLDPLLFMGTRADVHLEAGVDEEELHASRARFYREPDPPGRVCLVLGAGNVNSIPTADVLTKMFVEGKVCVLKMNPVNAYVGPLIEEAFAEAVARGFLAVVYGGAEEGAYLAGHPDIDEIHITGSDRTHDLLVWGPPGPERAERMARGKPLLAKAITSELGNVTPILVVPGPYTERQLAWQAESVAGMITQNASFNCIAGKMIVTPKGWDRRERFLEEVRRFLAQAPPRRAWYPGAADRYAALTRGRGHLVEIGKGSALPEGALPWALVADLDPEDREERAFRTEPFCSVTSEVAVGSADPAEFLAKAVAFANERLWGTLGAAMVVHPSLMEEPRTAEAVERAIAALRYGTVTVNTFPGFAFALTTLPWGAHPGSPLTDIQSGRGFVHNALMLEHVEKVVLRAPVISPVKPPYYPTHRTAGVLARRLVALEASGSLTRLPGVVAAALQG